MSFISDDFWWFVLLAFGLWFLARGRYSLQIALMVGISLIFYGFDHFWFPLVLLAYGVVDWGTALWMQKTRAKRAVLALGLFFNLGVLAVWKYTPLFSPETTENWILPMGVSFYSFSGISYMVDVYRGQIPAERNFWRYLLFTAFFPHLIAGPILRAREFLTDLAPATLPRRPLAPLEGSMLIARGYFKKLVLADSIAVAVDPFFAHVSDPSTAGVWSLPFLYLYALQIYCDFSGYIDIARGLGLWFGFRWPENFNLPYLATSVQDFWRRWHMTLSRFLRDYLYIPLGGNRCGPWRTTLNLMTTMVLGGLWHGAGVSFLFWGALHGIFLIINHLWGTCALQKRTTQLTGMARAFWIAGCITLTFHAVCFAWCFFRLTHFEDALACLRKLVAFDPDKMISEGVAEVSLWLPILVWLLVSAGVLGLTRNASIQDWVERNQPGSFLRGLAWGWALGLLSVALLLSRSGEKPAFIYFQF